jgi:hypothetical protein
MAWNASSRSVLPSSLRHPARMKSNPGKAVTITLALRISSAQLNSQIAHNIPLAVARCLGDVDAQRCRLAPSLNINPVA